MDKFNETCFACGKLVSFEDEGITKVKAFIAITEDEPSIGKLDARSDYTHVDIHYVKDQRKYLLSKFNSLNQEFPSCKSELNDLKNTKALNCSLQNEIARLNLENESLKDEIIDLKRKKAIPLKEVVFTKVDKSLSETSPETTSESESECRGSYPPLPTQGTTIVGDTPGKSLYANVIGKSSKKAVNIRTLFTSGGNTIDVFVSVESIQTISERFVNTAYDFFLRKRVAYPLYGWFKLNAWNGPWFIRNHPLILSKWNPDVDLLKEDVGNVPVWVKLHGVPITAFSEDGLSAIPIKLGTPLMLDSYTSDMCLQSWDMSSYAIVMIELRADLCSCCKVFGHTQDECPKNIGLGVAKNLKNLVKLLEKGVAHTNEVSNSNPFDVLKLVDNDVEFSTNGGDTNLVNNGANSTILMDEAGNPLKKVKCPGDYDIEDEVASVDNDMARSLASEWVGFGTQSLLEQWRVSYGNGDYDKEPYDDDLYEGQDLPQEI
ncbi:retrotransposon protein, putative, ty1-copia subclass [Tanacetum coccineum]|uniref:Retrotransposon protein, putative, ty1-copia subclass n=1 Tax=Tanacetum coccineum TaxID=301880 RepID=A0ABQ5CLK4_9ASTR